MKMRNLLVVLFASAIALSVSGQDKISAPIRISELSYEGAVVDIVERNPVGELQIREDGSLFVESEILSLRATAIEINGFDVWYVDSFSLTAGEIELRNHKFAVIPKSISDDREEIAAYDVTLTVNWFRPLRFKIEFEDTPLVPTPSTIVNLDHGLRRIPGQNEIVYRFASDPYSFAFISLPESWVIDEATQSAYIPQIETRLWITELSQDPHGQGENYVGNIDMLNEGAYAGWSGAGSGGKSNWGTYTTGASHRKSVEDDLAVAYLEINPNTARTLIAYYQSDMDLILENQGIIYSLESQVFYHRAQ